MSVYASDHVVLQATVDPAGESVSLQCGSSYVHLVNRGGAARVEVVSGGAMLLHAAGHLQIEGDSVLIRAKGGAVGVSDRARAGAVGAGAAGAHKATPKAPVPAKKASAPPPARPAHTGKYHSVVATRKGGPQRFAAYKDANGKVQEVRVKGTASWRYNNPGNMNPGSIASGAGAIGHAWVEPNHHGNTAVFPDEATGYDGARALLRSRYYKDLTMKQTVRKWVGVDLGQLPEYAKTVQKNSGVLPTEIVGDLTDSRLDSMAHAMTVAEGWKAGTTYTQSNVADAPQWVQDLFKKGKAP